MATMTVASATRPNSVLPATDELASIDHQTQARTVASVRLASQPACRIIDA